MSYIIPRRANPRGILDFSVDPQSNLFSDRNSATIQKSSLDLSEKLLDPEKSAFMIRGTCQ